MVLPLLLGMGLPALAASGALAGTMFAGLAGMSAPVLAGLGTGLGSFIQTGDLGKGIQTGLTSFVGGKLLGGLSGGASGKAINSAQAAGQSGGFLSAGMPISEVTLQCRCRMQCVGLTTLILLLLVVERVHTFNIEDHQEQMALKLNLPILMRMVA